jgi:6,7-dimethyl-8-ribityllumazine synthase
MATKNTNLSNYDSSKLPDASSFRFGLVVSEWNSKITEGLLNGVLNTFSDCNVLVSNVVIIHVPGSFELIFGSKKMQEQQVDVVIAIGSVIKGETQHFNFVCDGVTQGIKDLNVLNDVPVVFCLLTDNSLQQSIDRSGGKHGNKGVEAAITAIKMAHLNGTM